MKENGYSTQSRTRMLEYLMANEHRAVTVNEIHLSLEREGNQVNMTTIYRYLDKLCAEGTVLKYVAPKGSMATYQYVQGKPDCLNHMHMKCRQCGKVVHLDCEFMKDFENHIMQHHQFHILYEDCVLMGICSNCRKC